MQSARLQGPAEAAAVDGNQPEALAETGCPFEIVEQRPIEIGMHRNAVAYAIAKSGKRCVDERYPARVVVGRDAVFGHINRLFERCMRPAHDIGERLRVEFVTDVGQFCARRRSDQARSVDPKARVGLHADEISVGSRNADPVA